MRERCVTNFDAEGRVLLYDPDTGAYQEIARDQLPAERKIGQGFYVNVDNEVIGVYTTPSGPVCFYNQQRYPLMLGAWDATVTSDDAHDVTRGRNTFTFIHAGHQVFAISYDAPPHRYYDAWSACDEDVDFFLWLKSKVDNERFHTFYTQEWDFGEADLLPPARRT